jgi:PilZ domain
MDPNIIRELPGLPDAGVGRPAEDGAAHLRRLKAEADGDAQPAATGAPAAGLAIAERRRSPRFQCSGSVEFHPQDGIAHTWGTLTDISLHGCYVEMPNAFPVDMLVSLTIESLGIRFSTQAKVRASYPSLGMGMCFADIKPEQQTQLEQLLRALTGQRSALSIRRAETASPTELVAAADAEIFAGKLAEHFRKNDVLTRDQFNAIAKRVRRP